MSYRRRIEWVKHIVIKKRAFGPSKHYPCKSVTFWFSHSKISSQLLQGEEGLMSTVGNIHKHVVRLIGAASGTYLPHVLSCWTMSTCFSKCICFDLTGFTILSSIPIVWADYSGSSALFDRGQTTQNLSWQLHQICDLVLFQLSHWWHQGVMVTHTHQ